MMNAVLALLSKIQNTIGNENILYLSRLAGDPDEAQRFCIAVRGMQAWRDLHERHGVPYDDAIAERHSNNMFKLGKTRTIENIKNSYTEKYEIKPSVFVNTNFNIDGHSFRETMLKLDEQGRVLAAEWFYRFHLPRPTFHC